MSLAIIGGSGIYKFDVVDVIENIEVSTPFGKPSSKIVKAEIDGNQFYFLPRHGEGHAITPSEINYRANIYALKKLGVRNLISVSAVGSLKEEIAPRDFCLPDQFIDWTKGLRKRTFFEQGVVGHVSTAYPVNKQLQERVYKICETLDVNTHKDGSYLCIEGPQFSSYAESTIYRGFGASVIGMTNVPEAYLAKEAGMAYMTVALVTDYDCWKEEACSVEEIMKVLKDNYTSAQKLVTKLVPDLVKNPVLYEAENQYAIVTNPEIISPEKKEIIDTLLS